MLWKSNRRQKVRRTCEALEPRMLLSAGGLEESGDLTAFLAAPAGSPTSVVGAASCPCGRSSQPQDPPVEALTLAPGYPPSYGGSLLYESIQSVSYTRNADTMTITVYIYIANPTGCTAGNPCPEYDSSPEYVNAWIDFDGNQSFDPGEQVLNAALTGYMGINYAGTMSTTTVITVPEAAVENTWMRVNLGWGYDPGPHDLYWTWGDVQDKEVALAPAEITQLDTIGAVVMQGYSNTIWSKDAPSKFDPIVAGIVHASGGPGDFQIGVTIEPTGDLPDWEPTCEYSWSIAGTAIQGESEFTGWNGTLDVAMPEFIDTYQLELQFALLDGEGNEFATQAMSHKLYATYSDAPLAGSPKEIWVQKATTWAFGAQTPEEAAVFLNSGIYSLSGWTYLDEPNTWQSLVEGAAGVGNCVSFASVWNNLMKVLGVPGSDLAPFNRGSAGYGFLTNPATALDGKTGNAQPMGGSIDRWEFSMHEVGAFGGNYYDPTMGNVYSSYSQYIAWNVLDDFKDDPATGLLMAPAEGGRKVYYLGQDAAHPWGLFAYTSGSSSPLSPSLSGATYAGSGATLTGISNVHGVDTDGDGVFNALSIDVGVNVSTAGNYWITGSLLQGGEVVSLRASKDNSLPTGAELNSPQPGAKTVTLVFSGEEISQNAASGVFQVELAVLGSGGIVLDDHQYTTPTFNPVQFGEVPALIGAVSDHGTDTNSDARFDYLTATANLDVKAAGTYRVEAELYSSAGALLTMATTTYQATAEGTMAVDVNLDGRKIYLAGKDGPYQLHVHLLNSEGDQIDATAAPTGAYLHGDFASPADRFTGVYSDQAVDTNQDGSFDKLVVTVGVQITTPGQYSVHGWLYDGNGKAIEVASSLAQLAAGAQSVTLNFAGAPIHANEVDGPYYVKHLVLETATDWVDRVDEAATTAAYTASSFVAPAAPLISLTGVYSDHLEDTNDDGVAEDLTVDVQVQIAQSGYAVLKARLVDGDGQEICWATSISNLTAGSPQTMSLDFDGSAILDHGVKGPYLLRNVYLYATGDPSQPDFTDGVYTTAAYDLSEFVGPMVTSVTTQASGARHDLISGLTLQFSKPMQVASMIADGSITSAVTLVNLGPDGTNTPGTPVPLTAEQFSYDDSAQSLHVSLADGGAGQFLLAGQYQLQLNGAEFHNVAANPLPLLGGLATDGVVETVQFGAAQNVQAGGADLTVAQYSVPALADWNNDGLPDLIVGEKITNPDGELGMVRVYLNGGTAASPAYNDYVYVESTDGSEVTFPSQGCLGVFPRIFDWDQDGRKDLVVGLADGSVEVLLNQNTDADPAFGAPSKVQVGEPGAKSDVNVGGRATVSIVDWGDDGTYDLVVGGLDGRVHVFLNGAPSGPADFLSQTIVQDDAQDLTVPSGRASVVAIDMNSDGRKDLLMGNTDGQVLLYANTGTDASPAFVASAPVSAGGSPIDLGNGPRSRPFVGDFNGDGVPDILLGAADGLVRFYPGQLAPSAPTADINMGSAGGTYVYRFQASTAGMTLVSDCPSGSVVGQAVTFTVTIVSAGDATPTGTVTFKDGSKTLGTATLDADGKASCSTSSLRSGKHTIAAVYKGDSNTPAGQSTLAHVVCLKATSMGLTASASGQSATFTAIVSVLGPGAGVPTGKVTFKAGSKTLGTAKLNGSGAATLTTTASKAAGQSITAVYKGDKNCAGSSAGLAMTADQVATSTVLAASANPAVAGQSLTFTATVSAATGTPAGTVTFLDGSTPLGPGELDAAGVARFSTSALTVGSHTITASYAGNSTFTASSGTLTQTVNMVPVSLVMAASADPAAFGQTVTFTIVVSAAAADAGVPAGTVTLKDGSKTLDTLTLDADGTAALSVSTLKVGGHKITASYAGTSKFTASSSDLTETVNKAATTSAIIVSPDPSVFGQSVIFTATVGAAAPGTGTPTGKVVFKDGSAKLGTAKLDGTGKATLSTTKLKVGSHTITASYAGDKNFNASVVSVADTVNQAATTTAVTSSSPSSVAGKSVTFTAVVSAVAPGAGKRTGTVTFLDGSTTLATVSLNSSGKAVFKTSALTSGSHTITASYSGDANFVGSSGSVTQTVAPKATQQIVAAALADASLPTTNLPGSGSLAAQEGTLAASQADLLAAVMHAMAHRLGSDDATSDGCTSGILPVGAQDTAAVDQVFSANSY